MNKGVLVAVDFENKKIIQNQQHKSENSFYIKKEKVCDGEVTIFQTKKSGGIWHMRMYVADSNKYFQKSLRTRNYLSAKEKAQIEHAQILVNKKDGKAIFSPTLYSAVEQYLEYRKKDVVMGRITEGRFGTIKTQLKHLKKFLNAEHRLDTYTAKALEDYQTYRRTENNASDTTIRNEQAIINHFCNWAFVNGLHNTQKYLFPTISLRGVDKEKLRRATFTDDEYVSCYTDLRTYCSKKEIKAMKLDDDKAFVRHLFRHYFLIASNTMMRTSELFGLKWKNVEQHKDNLALITVEADTSKVRKARVFVARGWEHFERLKKISKHTKKDDYVFTDMKGKHWHKHNRRALDYQYHSLMRRVGITDWKERNLTLYSLRHYGITQRLLNGVTDLPQFALDCGTSVKHITDTYYHSNIEQSERNAKKMRLKKE